MKIRYFAWLRERTGIEEEDVDVPAEVGTVGDLIAFLAERDERHALAFEQPEVIRAALDHLHVEQDAVLGSAKEVAFFPPMTGG